VAWLEAHREQLDADSQARIHTNPLRVLDSKHPDTQALLAGAPTLGEALAPESRARFEAVQAALTALDIPFVLNPRLVRGLDYYSHTAFEITSSQLGAQATVCGGGRYDGLVQQLGGAPTPAIGWALGMERLVLLLEQRLAAGDLQLPVAAPSLYVISRGEAAERAGLALAVALRRLGLAVERDASGSAFGKQLKRAQRSRAAWVALIEEDDAASSVVRLKPLVTGADAERTLPLDDPAALAQALR
ncbi:MAG: histidine--tRNA ligase, partial [Cyanobacteria bacterium M_surface_7_m2_040]|nr:histidine--tRNA ligase [Cyanobacteria bacterium M_surface_7_m2_040]